MLIFKRRRQNQKFPSFQMFRFAAGGVGGAANKNDRKFLGFAPRELVERGRGAKVSRFVQNAFERSYIIPPEETASTLTKMLVSVVENGYGKLAKVDGYSNET